MGSIPRSLLNAKNVPAPASDDQVPRIERGNGSVAPNPDASEAKRILAGKKHRLYETIRRNPELSSPAKVVASALLFEFYNEEPWCLHQRAAAPGLTALAKAAGLGRSSVVRAIKELEASGVFIIVHAPKGSKNRHTNLYAPNWIIIGATATDNGSHVKRSTRPRLNLVEPSTRFTGGLVTRFNVQPPLPSISQSIRFPSTGARSREGNSLARQGQKESRHPDNPIKAFTLKETLKELRFADTIDADRGFALFQTLLPRPDGDPDRLKGAWINSIAKPKEDVRRVLLSALLWFVFGKGFPREFVPKPGWWLKHRGWATQWPYGTNHDTLDALENALQDASNPLEAFKAFARANLKSPFKALCTTGLWPDDDGWVSARNAFNAAIARGINPETIIKKARRKIVQTNGELPNLGWWIKREFGGTRSGDQADHEDAQPDHRQRNGFDDEWRGSDEEDDDDNTVRMGACTDDWDE